MQICHESHLILMITTKISILKLGIIIKLWSRFIVQIFFLLLHDLLINQVDEDLQLVDLFLCFFVSLWLQNQVDWTFKLTIHKHFFCVLNLFCLLMMHKTMELTNFCNFKLNVLWLFYDSRPHALHVLAWSFSNFKCNILFFILFSFDIRRECSCVLIIHVHYKL
jgi:hypothetical protein